MESAIIVLVLAVIFNPVRIWLQRRVDRLFYGSRQDPVRALAEVGSRLGTTPLAALVLKVPWPHSVTPFDFRQRRFA